MDGSITSYHIWAWIVLFFSFLRLSDLSVINFQVEKALLRHAVSRPRTHERKPRAWSKIPAKPAGCCVWGGSMWGSGEGKLALWKAGRMLRCNLKGGKESGGYWHNFKVTGFCVRQLRVKARRKCRLIPFSSWCKGMSIKRGFPYFFPPSSSLGNEIVGASRASGIQSSVEEIIQ
jgi:hypothetical protein